jgi:protein-L-isoaspartate(D-aspartate) O-methyltransferase
MQEAARHRMVDSQIARRGVRDEGVLAAMRVVPRESFIPADSEELAYEDSPLPIGEGQTISQPYVVALMIEAAAIESDSRVLEIGAGSGYAAAVISRIARSVHAIERHRSLADSARERFRRLGYDNIELRIGDGSGGWPQAGPFDAIMVAAGAPVVPQVLKEQLAIGGRLVIPVGAERTSQRLLKIVRRAADRYDEQSLGMVRFVPLVGEQGWRDTGPDVA